MLAYELDAVDDDDVIITADVDAFVMTKDILLPLNKVKKISDILVSTNIFKSFSTWTMLARFSQGGLILYIII